MSNEITFTIDDVEVKGTAGQSIMEAADNAGFYIPRLCSLKNISPNGSCRVCTVLVNGRPQTACTHPVAEGISVQSNTEEVEKIRRDIVDMLFVEGNHFCMICEKSGNCELQAMAYRLGILAPKFPYMFPKGNIDASHPDIYIDRNRCILCGRCVQVSEDIDGKHVFDFVGRGANKRVAVNSEAKLKDTDVDATDEVVDSCPVGAILRKRVGFEVPIGERLYDKDPIGSDIDKQQNS